MRASDISHVEKSTSLDAVRELDMAVRIGRRRERV